jgi:uncharacterized protein
MSTYKTPDVYIKEVPFFAPSVAQVETAVPAFIGLVEKAYDGDGKEMMPDKDNISVRRITSLLEYIQYFGEAKSITATVTKTGTNLAFAPKEGHLYALYYAINNYFSNGGGAAYIVAVGTYTGKEISADQIKNGLIAIEKIDEVTLLLCPDAAQVDKITQDDSTKKYTSTYYTSFAQAALTQAAKLQDRFVLIDVIPTPKLDKTVDALRGIVSSDLKYGAAYFPKLKTTLPYPYEDAAISLVGIKEIDKNGKETVNDVPTLEALKSNNDAEYTRVKAFLAQKTVSLPPSAAIAGVYAQTDAARGVWKAPANVALAQVIGPEVLITNEEQASLNVDPVAGKSINAIRAFTGKGTLVWGARTLAGNDNEWRYINVRRLFNTVEESIKKATYFAVFEPNTPMTWLKVKSMIESYLRGMWLDGALFGESTEQAFYVSIGLNQTMTEDDINNGLMKVKIGLAAVRPAEFIELSFSHKTIS